MIFLAQAHFFLCELNQRLDIVLTEHVFSNTPQDLIFECLSWNHSGITHVLAALQIVLTCIIAVAMGFRGASNHFRTTLPAVHKPT
ncbi:MAG: hypothetical protein ABFD64_12490 [Armatimonadota bacterium]